ncbi:hypothetical protein GCM10009123_15180 [Kangiella japonica]|uniref:DNA gyrase subunit B n=1 Tax=Kangiella japonica TaxID=647384 RepID=A0ABN0T0T3_9GAMM
MSVLLKIAVAVVVLLYPIAIYFGLQQFQPKYLALSLAALVILRASITKSPIIKAVKGLWLIVLVVGLSLAALSFFTNSDLGLKLYPVIISAGFLAVFTYSLSQPPSIIERLARLQEPDLPPEGVAYTRKVTKVWCGFFVLNILISLYTVIFSSTEIWTLYNGLVSYLLMGTLFISELIYRKCVVQRRAVDDKSL